MSKSKWFDNEKFWLSLLIVLSAAVRVFFLLKYEHMSGGGGTGNVERALSILENPGFASNFDGNSSTLYKYAIASFMCFWRDPVLAPRVFTSLFGILLVIPYYGVLKVLFDRTIAFFSSLVLVFYPLHVIQSSVTTPDAVYYFFLFCSFYYFFSYKSGQERLSVLLLSVLSFNIAALLRFECWLFIPVLFLLLWSKGKKPAFLFLVLSMVSPGVLLMLNQIFYDDFLYSFNAAGKTQHAAIILGRFFYDPRWWSWLDVLWRNSGASLVIGGLSGIILAFLMRQKRQLAIFFLVLLSALTVNTFSARMVVDKRYSILLALFLIPYAWFFVGWGLTFLGDRKKLFFLIFLIFPAVNALQIMQKPSTVASDMIFVVSPEIKALALWLKNNVRVDETLIIGNDYLDTWQNYIVLRSGIPSTRCLSVYTPLSEGAVFGNKGEFERYLGGHHPEYLVLNTGSYLQKILNLDLSKKSQNLGGATFKIMYEQAVPAYEKYLIYRISYPGSSGGGGDV